MFSSSHTDGSDAWYDDLEAWLSSQGIHATNESILIAREGIMREVGHFIPADMRFFHQLERADLEVSRKAS
jgi:hypothetical protein